MLTKLEAFYLVMNNFIGTTNIVIIQIKIYSAPKYITRHIKRGHFDLESECYSKTTMTMDSKKQTKIHTD